MINSNTNCTCTGNTAPFIKMVEPIGRIGTGKDRFYRVYFTCPNCAESNHNSNDRLKMGQPYCDACGAALNWVKWDNETSGIPPIRIVYTNYEDISKYIEAGSIGPHDIIYTIDTHENILIGEDLSINPVRSRIYCFSDVKTATTKINAATDTFEGQLVAILTEEGAYTAYIVNKTKHGNFYLTKLNEMDSTKIDYNLIGNKPIDNLIGTLGKPIVVSQLPSGTYKVKGQYKLSPNDATTYSASTDRLFIVDNETDTTSVQEISSKGITTYTVADDVVSASDAFVTEKWVKEQGYVTDVSLEQTLLDYATYEQIKPYVSDVVDAIIDDHLEATLATYLKETPSSDIQSLFS